MRRDERGVSATLDYALTLGITALLVTGLLLAGGTFLEEQRERTTKTELGVIGEQLAADLSAADRLARTANTDVVTIQRNLPETVAGSAYRITVVGGADERIVLTAADFDVTVVVDVAIQFQAPDGLFDPETTIDGGSYRVAFDGSDRDSDGTPDIEVENA